MHAHTHTHTHTHTHVCITFNAHSPLNTNTSSEIPETVSKKSTFKAWLRNLSKKPHNRDVKHTHTHTHTQKSVPIQGIIFTRNLI